MRGRISYYNEKNQTGMVVDKAKVAYEFKRSIWYDQHRLPVPDMYVDFKANGQGKVEQIKESSFLKLQRKYDVSENDFWQSVDEEALEDLAQSRRERLINDGILYINPSAIPEDYSINDCFLAFFADSVELIYKYEDMAFDEGKESERVDYFKLKRFMQKAKSQLVQTDGSIQVEPFNKLERDLGEIEYVMLDVLKQRGKKAELLFEEIYLSQQISFLRFERRLALDTQRIFELNLTIKRATESITMYRNRLNREQHEELIRSLEVKISRAQDERDNAEIEIRKIQGNKPRFEECIRRFKEVKYAEFIESFGFENELKGIIGALRTVVERMAYDYDVLLWQKATKSHIVRNTFFKQAAEGNFCTATFLRYYLKPLNKHTLSKPDEALYGYLAKYDSQIAKHVLILSEQKDKIDEIAMSVYENYKDSVAHKFLRAVDSLQYIRKGKADLALFDAQNRTLSPQELAENYANSRPKERFKILVFNAKQASRTQFGENIEIVSLMGYSSADIQRQILQMLPL